VIDLHIDTADGSEPTVYASGLIPGQDIFLRLNRRLFRIHRHGDDCHVHSIEDYVRENAKGGTVT